MSIVNRVNFVKGWPHPQIVEVVAQPSSGVTTLQAGMIGHLNNTTGTWDLGISAVGLLPFVFHNDQTDPDAGNVSTSPTLYNSVLFGGVHGIAHSNPLLYSTVQYGATTPAGSSNSNGASYATGTPAVGDFLYADVDGKYYVSKQAGGTSKNTGGVIIAQVTAAPFTLQGLSYITVRPDNRGATS